MLRHSVTVSKEIKKGMSKIAQKKLRKKGGGAFECLASIPDKFMKFVQISFLSSLKVNSH